MWKSLNLVCCLAGIGIGISKIALLVFSLGIGSTLLV